ncbi:MAG: DUF2490 domain-containing protein [Saprospiraceae bacterium]|nr:DUF2490 domain-containing protein [Saprospiraceae bacterium]
MNRTLLILFLGQLAAPLVAQGEFGNWMMYFGQNRISHKFSIHSEVQYRHHTILPTDVEQLLLRMGLNYHVASNAILTAGYGYITSYDFDGDYRMADKKEHRIWQQFLLTNQLGRIKFEHRYRIEQRWVDQIYSSRFRYRLMAFIPLNRSVIEPGAWFLGVYDEVFLNTKNTFFDRNRLFGGFGYQLSKASSFQLGFLNQRVNTFGKWYLQMAVTFNPDLRKKSS